MPKINSSMISWADYDGTKKELEITFTTGSVYTYFDVPKQIYDLFLKAPSQGKFFNQEIKNEYRNRQIK
jgi:hypothetical protein